MRFVSPLLKHALYPTLHHFGWLDHIMPLAGYAVVNYHGVVPVDHSNPEPFLDGNLVRMEVFRKQLQFLKAHYNVVHPEHFQACTERGEPLPPRALLVTCDDGLLNVLTDMLPVLQREIVPCLFFVTGASCANNPGMLWHEELFLLMRTAPPNEPLFRLPVEPRTESNSSESLQSRWWKTVARASRLDAKSRADWMELVRKHCGPIQNLRSEKRWRLMNITELQELAKSGMTIGAHTLTHPVLSQCCEEEARREILHSKIDLERALGRPIWAFAYPFGNPATMGQRELRLARDSGFSCAFVNVGRWSAAPSDSAALPRTHVTSNMKLPEFAAHLSGLHTRLQRAAGA